MQVSKNEIMIFNEEVESYIKRIIEKFLQYKVKIQKPVKLKKELKEIQMFSQDLFYDPNMIIRIEQKYKPKHFIFELKSKNQIISSRLNFNQIKIFINIVNLYFDNVLLNSKLDQNIFRSRLFYHIVYSLDFLLIMLIINYNNNYFEKIEKQQKILLIKNILKTLKKFFNYIFQNPNAELFFFPNTDPENISAQKKIKEKFFGINFLKIESRENVIQILLLKINELIKRFYFNCKEIFNQLNDEEINFCKNYNIMNYEFIEQYLTMNDRLKNSFIRLNIIFNSENNRLYVSKDLEMYEVFNSKEYEEFYKFTKRIYKKSSPELFQTFEIVSYETIVKIFIEAYYKYQLIKNSKISDIYQEYFNTPDEIGLDFKIFELDKVKKIIKKFKDLNIIVS